jgi:hypothetical protein
LSLRRNLDEEQSDEAPQGLLTNFILLVIKSCHTIHLRKVLSSAHQVDGPFLFNRRDGGFRGSNIKKPSRAMKKMTNEVAAGSIFDDLGLYDH